MEVGIKCGSLNTAIAYRDGKKLITEQIRTCIRYRKNFINNSDDSPIIGEKACEYSDSIQPLDLGVVENEEGVQQTMDILNSLNIPKKANIVLASPAMEINEGKNRLVRAIKGVCDPIDVREFSEGLCSAIYILNNPSEILSSTFFSINLGSSTTEFGCISEGRIVHLSAHSELSGKSVESEIGNRVRNAVSGAMFNPVEIRDMKEQTSVSNPKEFIVKGTKRDGFIESAVQHEVSSPIIEYIDGVADIIKSEILNNINPRIRKKALEMPLNVSGGMSNIDGLPEMLGEVLSKKMNYEFKVMYPTKKDAHIAPAIGALLLCEEIVKEELT